MLLISNAEVSVHVPNEEPPAKGVASTETAGVENNGAPVSGPGLLKATIGRQLRRASRR